MQVLAIQLSLTHAHLNSDLPYCTNGSMLTPHPVHFKHKQHIICLLITLMACGRKIKAGGGEYLPTINLRKRLLMIYGYRNGCYH